MKNRILSMSLAVVLALNVGLGVILVGCEGEDGGGELELMIYKVEPVIVNPEDIQDLASTLFALNDTPEVNETPELYYVSVGPLYLESCRASGSIWYSANDTKLYNEEYVPGELASTAEAPGIALQFLENHGLIPETPEEMVLKFIEVSETETTRFDVGTNETNTVINHLDVLYSVEAIDQDIGNIPVYGPGAEIRVSIGDQGEILGLHYVWREVEPDRLYPAITQDEAEELLRERLGGEPVGLETTLAYYAESEFIEQDFLQPYYIFDGAVVIGGDEVQFKTQLIPATTFSPVATILSPDDGATFSEGDTIDFEASVSGGVVEEEYQYTWESDIDGVIGTGASVSHNLSVCQRDEGILPHTIKLTVEDDNGSQDIVLISVTVTPSTLTGSAPEEIQTLLTGSPNDDGNNKEVGIEWVNDYSSSPLSNNDNNAKGFKNVLVLDGWVPSFDYGNWWAWEQDFKYRNGDGGGTDYIYIDTVDFAFFSGHGDPTYILFGNSIDYERFYFERARWGGYAGGTPGEAGDLEWIVLDACLTLKLSDTSTHDVFSRWDQAFDGLHYVLGFHTTCSDVKGRGAVFALYMKLGWSVRSAWIRATQATQGSSCRGAYLRAGTATALTQNDHLPGHGYVSPDPHPWTYLLHCRWSC